MSGVSQAWPLTLVVPMVCKLSVLLACAASVFRGGVHGAGWGTDWTWHPLHLLLGSCWSFGSQPLGAVPGSLCAAWGCEWVLECSLSVDSSIADDKQHWPVWLTSAT